LCPKTHVDVGEQVPRLASVASGREFTYPLAF
jgi:hypothetical protein